MLTHHSVYSVQLVLTCLYSAVYTLLPSRCMPSNSLAPTCPIPQRIYA